jgi:ATPase subunit of ABC transporter with duplicated ATPase domains
LSDIGYLDQHYGTLSPKKSVLETIADLVPTWSHAEIRRHLNDFLFRKNAEVNALVATLSGGEKVRLTLAQIAAKTPQLLILDEITNNLDLETREHVIQVLKEYPGSMIVISHDEDFLHAIDIQSWYEVKNGTVLPKV